MKQVLVGVIVFLVLANCSIQANKGVQPGVRDRRAVFKLWRLGREALRGLMARNKLLSGAEEVKPVHADSRFPTTRTFLKIGDWGDLVRDFNSISPTDITSTFKDQIIVGHAGDRVITVRQMGLADKPTLSIFKPNSKQAEAQEVILYMGKRRDR